MKISKSSVEYAKKLADEAPDEIKQLGGKFREGPPSGGDLGIGTSIGPPMTNREFYEFFKGEYEKQESLNA